MQGEGELIEVIGILVRRGEVTDFHHFIGGPRKIRSENKIFSGFAFALW